jgi:hypothetical protein
MESPDKLDLANEVLASAIRVLQAAGFYEDEIAQLFDQVAKGWKRGPLWLQPLQDQPAQPQTKFDHLLALAAADDRTRARRSGRFF